MHRVVLTGLGAISPCGLTVPETWAAVREARSGIGLVTGWDTTGWAVRIAGEVAGFDPNDHFDRKQVRRIERFVQFAIVAAREAMRDAGLPLDRRLGPRAGVYLGSGIGGAPAIARNSLILAERGPRRISPFFIPQSLTNLAGGYIAMEHGCEGPSLCVSTACATGNHSIGEAWRVIRSGDADLVIAGGTEASLFNLGLAGFMSMRALSKCNDDPARASRPFDASRDGFVMAEGAGVVVMESLERARARGARIHAEVLGYALTNDAHHITSPPEGHSGAVRCMRLALQSAGLEASQIDYINAHGTSTQANDRAESQAIRTVFGDHADQLLVSSTKGVTGHLLGAAGGLEAVLCARALAEQVVPPTAHLREPGDGCDLDYVAGSARPAPIRYALSNAFGFGGTNAVIILGRAPDS
ncbi:MAG: beta-ketoacyl-[acyl-carrier-protein] synthase II [Deltaproteobacteria bacterium]|nr:beta-ketoacyl-[acyl-carrier-protein] synthase II [Deltaproteobacteria bacterium]HCH61388.1 beta-ketoacyl-[acyl-carrier-protein] synthase II [Deltaproteobacteria bacterium]